MVEAEGGGPVKLPESEQAAEISLFEISEEAIKVSLQQGETTTRAFTITSRANTDIALQLSVHGLEKYAVLSDSFIEIKPGEERTITLDITAPEEIEAYFGAILIAGEQEKTIPLIIEVAPKEGSFDVEVAMSPRSKKLARGDFAEAKLKFSNYLKNEKIHLDYAIKSVDGTIMARGSEYIALGDDGSIIRNLKVPDAIAPGRYIFYAKAQQGSSISISSDFFEVVEKRTFAMMVLNGLRAAAEWLGRILSNVLFYYAVGVLVFIAAALFLLSVLRKLNKAVNKAKKDPQKKAELQKNLETLKKAYQSGYLKKEAYLKDKRKIEKEIRKIK